MLFSIGLYENPKVDTIYIRDLTPFLRSSWRHSVRDWGGCWDGDGTFEGLSAAEMEDLFLTGLGQRVVVSSGGNKAWDGQIVRLELVKDGQTWTRSLLEVANRVKVIYTKIGPNLLTNGDVESAVWSAIGTPTTHATSSVWFSKGALAMRVITDAISEGTKVTQTGGNTTAAIVANQAYICQAAINQTSATGWSLQVTDQAGSTVIAERDTTAAGKERLQCQVPETNTTTVVSVQLIAAGAGAAIYADDAQLRTAPVASETEWVSDDESIAQYGRIEGVFLDRERTDTEASNVAARELVDRAWPRTEPADRGGAAQEGQGTSLTISCKGWVWSLGWRHTRLDAVDQASDHVTNLLAESELFSTSDAIIDTNAAEVEITARNPITLWRAMEKALDPGDNSANYWMAGCYPDWEFRYQQRPTATDYEYIYHAGEVRYRSGGLVDPLEFAPGWCMMVDMPYESWPAGATAADDPRLVWLSETWFVADAGGAHVEWSRQKKAR